MLYFDHLFFVAKKKPQQEPPRFTPISTRRTTRNTLVKTEPQITTTPNNEVPKPTPPPSLPSNAPTSPACKLNDSQISPPQNNNNHDEIPSRFIVPRPSISKRILRSSSSQTPAISSHPKLVQIPLPPPPKVDSNLSISSPPSPSPPSPPSPLHPPTPASDANDDVLTSRGIPHLEPILPCRILSSKIGEISSRSDFLGVTFGSLHDVLHASILSHPEKVAPLAFIYEFCIRWGYLKDGGLDLIYGKELEVFLVPFRTRKFIGPFLKRLFLVNLF